MDRTTHVDNYRSRSVLDKNKSSFKPRRVSFDLSMHSSRSDSDISLTNSDNNNINQSELACWGLDNSGQSLVPANAAFNVV